MRVTKELKARLISAVELGDLQKLDGLLVEAKRIDMSLKFVDTEPGKERKSPLEIAVEAANEPIACRLIQAGAKLTFREAPDTKGWEKIIYKAIESRMSEVLRLLIEGQDQRDKDIALLHVVRENHVEAAQLFLKYGAQPNWQDIQENNALFTAVAAGNIALVELLLEYNASLERRTRDGSTVFDIALKNDNQNVMDFLLSTLCKSHNIKNNASVYLDKTFKDKDFKGALSLLQAGSTTTLRLQAHTRHKDVEPLTGLQDEYLQTLCEYILSLQDATNGDTNARIKDTSSDKHFLCASKWLLECLTEHSNCILAESGIPKLPSRVIDVGLDDKIKLVETNSLSGRYVALSHRWGNSAITKTTKKTLRKRLEGINYGDLTKTMRDAVIITRRLGVRYLWIDAMCIIQDSHSDWSDEAGNMANIYRNALFTISVAAAANHSEGCFASRDKSGPGGDLTSRGWILQEQLLSPRILEYNKGFIKWECISHSQDSDSELFPKSAATNVSHRDKNLESIHFKRALFGFRSTSMSLERQAHISWQKIVASYTKRTLTKDSDKLMAIIGIANFLQSNLDDEFVAGMWKKQLYRDLLWTSEGDARSRISSIDLPSWSWASLAGSISYSQWPSGSSPTYITSMVEVISVPSWDTSLLHDDKSELVLEGILQLVVRGKSHDSDRLFPSQKPPVESEEEQDVTTKGSTLKSGLFSKLGSMFSRHSRTDSGTEPEQSQSKGIKISMQHDFERLSEDILRAGGFDFGKPRRIAAMYIPDVASESFDTAWVLPIAKEQFWMHCLVLAEVKPRGEDGSTQTKKVFRRIGRCYVDALKRNLFFGDDEKIELVLV